MLPEGSYFTEEMLKRFSTDGTWRNVDLYSIFAAAVSENPNGTAMVSYKDEYGQRFDFTYTELSEEVDKLASALLQMGIKSGDVISIQLPNWWEFVAICFAAYKIGAVINGLTPIYREKQVSFIMGMTDSKVIFIPKVYRKFDYLNMILSLWPTLASLEKVIVVDEISEDFGNENIISFKDIINSQGTDMLKNFNLSVDPNQLAQLAFTSGTTGEPKGVMHTHNTLEATVRNFILHMQTKKGVRDLVVTPVGHQSGFLWGMMLPIFLQSTMIFLDVWNPERALEIMHEQGVTHMIAAFPFLHDISMLNNISERRANTLEFVCIPGAPIPRHMVRICSDRLDCIVVAAWGMTEYGIALAVAPSDPPSGFLTDGRLLNGAEVRIINENGEEVEAGIEGNLQIRGAGLLLGYYKRPEITRANFREDGWFDTGDRATKTDKGFISITGRTKDIVIRGGENIPVVEVENLLMQWDKVRDVAIVAMPDERLGERACAYAVPAKESFTFEEMIQYLLKTGIAKQMLPERLEIVQELPRTASGKVQKYILRNDIKEKLHK